MLLSNLKVGDRAKVVGYTQKDKVLRKKLLAMGLVKGTEIEVIRTAPLGDPVEIEVRGFQLSLRKEEAQALHVEG
ncbi:MAG: ferrous iron transport protein A [Desulfobacterales bacterium]|nr:MAG: ferrous iron transport protein A [Desulfobacterales bacterium]